MATEHDDARWADTEARLARLEAQVAQLQAAQGIPPPLPLTAPPAAQFIVRPPSPASPLPPSTAAAAPPTSAPDPYVDNAPQATRDMGSWLGYAGIFCLVIAAGFIVRLAVEQGWLTPPRQIAGAALLGFALIGIGLRWTGLDRDYVSMLPAGGVSILYLTSIGAHGYAALINAKASMVCVVLVCVLSLRLWRSLQRPVYATLAVLGAFGASHMVTAAYDGSFLIGYLACISLAYSMLSGLMDSPYLSKLTLYLALLTTLAAAPPAHACLGTGAYAALLIWHVAATGLHLLVQPAHRAMPWTSITTLMGWLPALVLVYVGEWWLVGRDNPLTFALCCAAVAFVVMGGILARSKAAQEAHDDPRDEAETCLLWGAALGLGHSVFIEALDDAGRAWAMPCVLVLIFVAARLGARLHVWMGPLAVGGIIVCMQVVRAAQDALYQDVHAQSAALVVTIALAWGALGVALRNRASARLPLAIAAHMVSAIGLLHASIGVSSLGVSLSWLGYAVFVLALGWTRQDMQLVRSILPILTLAGGKALTYDVAQAPSVVRILCLLATGACLYAAGLLWRRVQRWPAL